MSAQPETAGDSAAPELDPETAQRRLAASKKMAAAFGEITTLLMRSPVDKHHSLADLEWMVAPALVRGQFVIAEARSKATGAAVPAATVLWATVSADVDARLSDASMPMRLQPDEWNSGDIPWIVLASGDPRLLAGVIQEVTKTALGGRQPKMRVRGEDGKVRAGFLQIRQEEAAP